MRENICAGGFGAVTPTVVFPLDDLKGWPTGLTLELPGYVCLELSGGYELDLLPGQALSLIRDLWASLREIEALWQVRQEIEREEALAEGREFVEQVPPLSRHRIPELLKT